MKKGLSSNVRKMRIECFKNNKMKKQLLAIFCGCLLLMIGCKDSATTSDKANYPLIKKKITLLGQQRFQTMDGFGVNITPAQWRGGNLKKVIDSLVDDLGCTLIRFDCYGMANWLDASKQLADGSFPADYLQQVYTSSTFKDAWATFKYLNNKGIEPIFNISGAVPISWTTANELKHDRLKNFDAYAAMAASLLVWARQKEGLKFSYFMPFNETDLGYPEGPRLLNEDCVPAINAVLKKLAENKLGDIQCIVMDDANVNIERIKNIATNVSSPDKIKGVGVHTYGNGGDEDGRAGWLGNESQFAKAKNVMQETQFKDKSLLLTEYGDLDQTEEIEFAIGWRSTRRLLKILNDGFTGGLAWDAFDNFHEHDTAWAKYGLFKTDTINWTYTPKERYYAAKQVYKYVRPGYQMIGIEPPQANQNYVYKEWVRSLRNMLLAAFISPDGKNFTLTGMSSVEADVELEINLKDCGISNHTEVNYYRTNVSEQFKKVETKKVDSNRFKIIIPPHSIFTITTLP